MGCCEACDAFERLLVMVYRAGVGAIVGGSTKG